MLVPKPGTEPMTPGWPARPVTAANLQRQFDYPPVFLPKQPQVMRYVWKEVRQAEVSGGAEGAGGCRGTLQTSKAKDWTQNTRFQEGEEEGPHKSNFPKKGEMHQMRRWR